MTMQPIDWELAAQKIEPAKFEKPLEGRQVVKILNAVHDKLKKTYTLTLWTQLNETTTDITYYLTKKSKVIPGEEEENQMSMRSLYSLSKAIYGNEFAAQCTIPNPTQAIGCAVLADIKINKTVKSLPVFDENQMPVMNEDGTQKTEPKERTFVNIYEYFPLNESNVNTYSDYPHVDQDGNVHEDCQFYVADVE